jgi:hypothetical protein
MSQLTPADCRSENVCIWFPPRDGEGLMNQEFERWKEAQEEWTTRKDWMVLAVPPYVLWCSGYKCHNLISREPSEQIEGFTGKADNPVINLHVV